LIFCVVNIKNRERENLQILGRFLVEFRVLRGSEEIAGIKSAKFLISGLLTPNTMPQITEIDLETKS
jgi:hypothetical protein